MFKSVRLSVLAFIEANLTVSRSKIDALSLIGKAEGALASPHLEYYPPPCANSQTTLCVYHQAIDNILGKTMTVTVRQPRTYLLISSWHPHREHASAEG
jgi:hypothetical protein